MDIKIVIRTLLKTVVQQIETQVVLVSVLFFLKKI